MNLRQEKKNEERIESFSQTRTKLDLHKIEKQKEIIIRRPVSTAAKKKSQVQMLKFKEEKKQKIADLLDKRYNLKYKESDTSISLRQSKIEHTRSFSKEQHNSGKNKQITNVSHKIHIYNI